MRQSIKELRTCQYRGEDSAKANGWVYLPFTVDSNLTSCAWTTANKTTCRVGLICNIIFRHLEQQSCHSDSSHWKQEPHSIYLTISFKRFPNNVWKDYPVVLPVLILKFWRRSFFQFDMTSKKREPCEGDRAVSFAGNMTRGDCAIAVS